MTESPMARRLREQREAAALQETATSQVAIAAVGDKAATTGTPLNGSAAAQLDAEDQSAKSQLAPSLGPAAPDAEGNSETAPATSQVATTEEPAKLQAQAATSQVAGADGKTAELEDTATSQVALFKPRSQGVLVSDTDQIELDAIVARCRRLGLKLRGSQYLSLVSRAGWRLLHDTADDTSFKAAIENGRAVRRPGK